MLYYSHFSFDWIRVDMYNNTDNNFVVVKRCGHCTMLFDDKLFIFGGMNSKNFVGSALFIVNLNIDFNPVEGKGKKVSFEPFDIKTIQKQMTLKHHTSLNIDELNKHVITETIEEDINLPLIN